MHAYMHVLISIISSTVVNTIVVFILVVTVIFSVITNNTNTIIISITFITIPKRGIRKGGYQPNNSKSCLSHFKSLDSDICSGSPCSDPSLGDAEHEHPPHRNIAAHPSFKTDAGVCEKNIPKEEDRRKYRLSEHQIRG